MFYIALNKLKIYKFCKLFHWITVWFHIDFYPKVSVLTYGLTNSFGHTLLVEKGFLIYCKHNISWIALGDCKFIVS